jgi:hypothetical protein
MGIPSDIDIQRLIGLRNEIVGVVAEWKKHGWGKALAVRMKALAAVLDDDPTPAATYHNHSTKRALTMEECQTLINGALLVQAWQAGGKLDIRTQDIYQAHSDLGTLAIAISDDDAIVTITGMKSQ